MTLNNKIERRRFLQLATGVAVPFLVGCNLSSRAVANSRPVDAAIPATGATLTDTGEFRPDVEMILRARPGSATIRPGEPTKLWTITGELIVLVSLH